MLGEVTQGVVEEGLEGVCAHLSGRHGELAVLDATAPADVALHRHVIRRVGEDDGRQGLAHQLVVACPVQGVAAEQAMGAQPPEIARPGDRRPAARSFLLVRRLIAHQAQARNLQVDLGKLEAGGVQVEAEVLHR